MLRKKNEVIKETVLFILESALFTFSIFGSWVMEQSLGVDIVIEVAVQCCIIAFYIIRMWGSEELTEKPFSIQDFSIALIPVAFVFVLNGFEIQNEFSWKMIPLCLIAATCEELHFRVNGCHLFKEDGNLGYFDCAMLISVFAGCRLFEFIVEGIALSFMTVAESFGTGIVLLGLYLKTGNTKSVVLIHALLLMADFLVFKSGIPEIELINIVVSFVIGIFFIKKSR